MASWDNEQEIVDDSRLGKLLKERRAVTQRTLESLQADAESSIKDCLSDLKTLVLQNGFQWCRDCDGTGAVGRLDAGIMRKFGMREWDGCKRCGGTRETRGKGYV